MPRLIAVEWDAREARIVLASTRGREVLVEQAFAVALSAAGETPATSREPGEKIAAALAARRIGKVEALVAVGRANLELKQMSLPPAPDDELPELVKFQAVREFNSLSADAALDFVPLDSDPTQPRNVLAGAMSSELATQIQRTCQTAGLTASRLILRPYAAASLLRRRPAEAGQRVRLLVDLLSEEADLTVTVDDRVVSCVPPAFLATR